MTETQKQGRSTDARQDEWEHDLHPNPMAGQNHGLETAESEKNAPSAHDLKEVRQYLSEFSDSELKQIPVLLNGTRLQQGATYINLMDEDRQEFTAIGSMEAQEGSYYVPKTEVDYQLWNRLTQANKAPERVPTSEPTQLS